METLWGEIGYKPKITSEENPEEEDLEEDLLLDDITVKNNTGFTPQYKKLGPGTHGFIH